MDSPESHRASVTVQERESLAGHQGGVVWFTGLSGSGKTTVARLVDRKLYGGGQRSFLLDGDALRTGLNSDLGFSPESRTENLRRFAEVARLFAEAGVLVLISAIAPYEHLRRRACERIGASRFVLIHVATPLSVCESRDVKGLYRRARAGEIKEFTGIDAPYEEPERPDLRLSPEDGDPAKMADLVMEVLRTRGLIPDDRGTNRKDA